MKKYIRSILNISIVIFIVLFNDITNLLAEPPADNDIQLEELLKNKISNSNIYDQKIFESPNSIIIISQEDIQKYGYQNLNELLSTLPGFFSRTDLNYDYIGVRGLERPSSFNNILILVNGHVLNENIYGFGSTDNTIAIDMNHIKMVEVIQGASSTLYGSGAMVTLINIVLKNAKETNGINAKIKYGSNNSKYANVSFGKLFDDYSIVFSGQVGNSDGRNFFLPHLQDSLSDGISKGMDWEKFAGGTLLATYKDFSLNCYYSFREKAIPNAPYQSVLNASPEESMDNRFFADLIYKTEIQHNKTLKFRTFFDGYDFTDVYQYYIPCYDKNIGRWFGSELDFSWDINSKRSILIGTNFTRNSNAITREWDSTTLYFANDIPYNSGSVYLQSTFQVFDNLSFNVGARADFLSYSNPNFNPKVGIIYNPSNMTSLKFLANSAFRTPSIYELYADDPSFKRKNVALKNEQLSCYEIVWEQELTDNLIYSLSGYNYKFKNLIELSYIDEQVPDSGVAYKNMGLVNSFGLEADIKLKNLLGFSCYLNSSYQVSKDIFDKQITNSPQLLAKLGLSYKWQNSIIIGLESKYESSRKTLYNTLTDPVFLFDSNIMYQPDFDEENPGLSYLNHFSIALRVKNIFNTNYYYPGSNWISSTSVEQYGRVITSTISFDM